MVKSMADNPIIFAMANPDPEITPEEAHEARSDAIICDRPVGLSQPGQQRPRLPLHLPRRARCARTHHQRRDEDRGRRCARALAREDVPDEVAAAYGATPSFGPGLHHPQRRSIRA
jgi:malate dehydrogenase (oxaloacetate-decarboxylating)(NADP+)